MKKLFLFTCLSVLALSFNSCSGDDDSSSVNNTIGGTTSFKLNGASRSFGTSVVDVDAPDQYDEVWLTVTSSDGTAANYVSFELQQGSNGANAVPSFTYRFMLAGDSFSASYQNFSTVVTESDDHHIKGTFTGTITSDVSGTPRDITDGAFDIRY